MSQSYTTLADFEPWELEAFADGEPLAHVATFVAHHPAAWQAWLAQAEPPLPLTASLFRFDCPTLDQLRGYLWQTANPAVTAEVDTHLPLCPHCSAELTTLRQLVLTTAAANAAAAVATIPLSARLQAWWQQAADNLQIAVAHLVTPLAPGPALPALRSTPAQAGASTADLRLYETDGADISLLVERSATTGAQLAAQIYTTTVPVTASYRLWATTSAAAVSAGGISRTGTFQISGLATGDYQLVIQLGEQLVVIPTLHL